VEEHQEELERMVSRLTASQDKEATLEEELEALKASFKTTEAEVATKSSLLDDASGKLDEATELTDTLHAEVSLLKKRDAELERAVEEGKTAHNKMFLELQSCNDVIAQLSGQAQQAGGVEEAYTELQKAHVELKGQVTEMTVQLEDSINDKEVSESSLREMMLARDDLKEDVIRLTGSLESATSELSTSKTALERNIEELEADKKELHTIREQRAEVEDRLVASEEEGAARRAALEYQLSEMLKESSQWGKRLMEQEEVVMSLQTQLRESHEAKKKQESLVEEAHAQTELLKQNHEAMKKTEMELAQREKTASATKLLEAEEQTESLRMSLIEAKEENYSVREMLQGLKAKLKEADASMWEARNERDSAQALLSNVNEKSPALSFQSCEQTKDSVSPMPQSPCVKVQELEARADNAEAELKELEAECVAQAEVAMRSTQRCEELMQEKVKSEKALNEALAGEVTKSQKMELEAASLKQALTEGKEALAKSQTALIRAQEEYESEAAKAKSMQSAVEEARTAASQSGELNSLREECDELRAKLEEKDYMTGVDQAQLMAKNEDYENLVTDRNECLERMMAARADADTYYEQTVLKKEEVEQLKEKLSAAGSEIKAQKDEVNKLMRLSNPNAKIQHVNKMKEEFNKVQKERNSLFEQFEKKKRQFTMLEKQFAKSGGKIDMAAIEEMDADVEQLKRKLQRATEKHEGAEANLLKLSSCLTGQVEKEEPQDFEVVLKIADELQKTNKQQERLIKKKESEIFLLTRKQQENRRSSMPIAGAPHTVSHTEVA